MTESRADRSTPRNQKTVVAWWAGVLSTIAGIVMVVSGGTVWGVVSSQLAEQKIVVSDDAPFLAGSSVTGPFSALAQTEAIGMHATEMAGGKSYAELAEDDPIRATVMDASFLRASLFTSVVSFGVAFFAMGAGLVIGLLGFAVTRLSRRAD